MNERQVEIIRWSGILRSSIAVVLAMAFAGVVGPGCSAGEVTTGVCTDGEVIDEYICERNEWVLYEGPCLEIDCGNHGACHEIDGEASCQCDSGYVDEDDTCVAAGGDGDGDDGDGDGDVDGPGPCADFNCGTHGQCTEVGEEAVCDCLDGYVEENWVCVPEEVDPCEDFNCGPNGQCVASGDSGSCDCDSGYTEESDYCVSEESPCDDVDCSGNGTCDDSTGSARCNCHSGFEADGLQCVEEPPECTGAGECAVYILDEGSDSYRVIDYEDTGLFEALDGPIVAAFDIEGTNRGYVFTESTFYRVNTANFALLTSGPVGELHPDLPAMSTDLQAAYSTPGNPTGNDDVTFGANPNHIVHSHVLVLKYNFSTSSFEEFDPHRGWFEHTWEQFDNHHLVPETSDNFVVNWLDMENSRGFAQGGAADSCQIGGESNAEDIPYFGIMTQNRIHYQLADACFPFTHLETFTQSPIFGFANAPDPDDLGAAFWHNGALYLFTKGYYD